MALPRRPTRSIKIAKKYWDTYAPAVRDRAVYIADPEQEMLRLDPPYETPTWRLPANDFTPVYATMEVLILTSGPWQKRGVKPSTGETIWDLGRPGERWVAAGERAFGIAEGLRIAEITTGELIGSQKLPPFAEALRAICGQTLIFSTRLGADPTYALDVEQGRELWTRDLGKQILAAAEGVNYNNAHFGIYCGSAGSAVVLCAGSLFGLSLMDGSLRWHRPFWVASGRPVMDGGRVYFWAKAGDSNECHFVCLDERTGETVYDHLLSEYGENFRGQEAGVGFIHERQVAFAARSGVVAVFRLSDGQLVWSYRNAVDVRHPVLTGGHLLVTAMDGRLLMFRDRDPG